MTRIRDGEGDAVLVGNGGKNPKGKRRDEFEVMVTKLRRNG